MTNQYATLISAPLAHSNGYSSNQADSRSIRPAPHDSSLTISECLDVCMQAGGGGVAFLTELPGGDHEVARKCRQEQHQHGQDTHVQYREPQTATAQERLLRDILSGPTRTLQYVHM